MEIFNNNIKKLERLTIRERLGELIVRFRLFSVHKFAEIMNEYNNLVNKIPLGEFLVEKEYISTQKLIEILNFQKIQAKVTDNCLSELGLMTNQKKWENITRSDKIGELMIKMKKISLAQLIISLEEQEKNSSDKLLGEIIVEKGFTDEKSLSECIKIQEKQRETIMKTINEMITFFQIPIQLKIRNINNYMENFKN